MSGKYTTTVVGIGASAGGIEALRGFFEHMPAGSGLAFIVLVHLAPDRRSELADIIGRWSSMPAAEACDGDELRPGRILVVPPGVIATLDGGRIRLCHVGAEIRRPILPIDALFESMATSLAEHAVGIVLSGTGRDGALGLRAIKARNGQTLAQGSFQGSLAGVDASAPQHHGMPDAAIATGAVDHIVPVEAMPACILALRALDATDQAPVSDALREARQPICEVLRTRVGHDFSRYKELSFMRRVQRRMLAIDLADPADYVARLETDREQVSLLFRDLLISVTSFFRDTETFAMVEHDVLPRLFHGKGRDDSIRLWIPGCATGEEAYSLAMLLREAMDRHPDGPGVQIFASDIDDQAIAFARAGRYPASLLNGLSPERVARFFDNAGAGHDGQRVVGREIRDLVTFSAHSLIRDPPFSRMDMVSCRNLLIYLDSSLQSDVVPIFHYALAPGGILLLGLSETLVRHERYFTPLDQANRVFIRRDGPRQSPRLAFSPPRRQADAVQPPAPPVDVKAARWKAINTANRRVLERFASAYVVTDALGEIVHYSTGTGKYLEPAAGAPSANLYETARRGWSAELRAVLRRCIEMGVAVEHERLFPAGDGAENEAVKLVVEPLSPTDADPLYLIVFVEIEPLILERAASQALPLGAAGLLAQLERENRDLREQLASISEEHGTALEELRSSNEELQSVNEEMQSANEEMQTSKEEIQSINEELNTVNNELSGKIGQLARVNADFKTLFESTKVATMLLDTALVIRSYTPEIATVYNLIPGDIGRPLTDIVSRLDYTTLTEDVAAVLATLQPMERRVGRKDASVWFLMRILPYSSPDRSIDGSLITFTDVTSLVRAEEHQRLLVDELNHRVRNMLTVVLSLAANTARRATSIEQFTQTFIGRVTALNKAYALVSDNGWQTVPLRELAIEELAPVMSDGGHDVVLDGPEILVAPRQALAIGMALHELTTNAVKHGALSVPEGKVRVQWSIRDHDGQERLTLEWIESGGPLVHPPTRRGFGVTLIERGLAHDLGGTVRVEFRPEGLLAQIEAPLAAATAPG